VEIDVRQDAVMTLEREWILTDEQVFMPLEAEHAIARGDTDQATVGRDAHEGRVEVSARPAVPARGKRRGKRQPVVTDRDRGDLMSGTSGQALEAGIHDCVLVLPRAFHGDGWVC
jgi:hypothetical protein